MEMARGILNIYDRVQDSICDYIMKEVIWIIYEWVVNDILIN